MNDTEPNRGRTTTAPPRSAQPPPNLVRPWWRLRRRTRSDIGRWPYTIGICATLATLVGFTALHERGALDPVDWPVVALVSVAVAPWIIDLLIVEIPPPVFAPAVLVPVAILHDPTQFDPLPLLLAVLALDMGLWLGPRRSIPVIAVATATVMWPLATQGTYVSGWLSRPLTAIAIAWAIGLTLHARVQARRARAARVTSSPPTRSTETGAEGSA